MFTGFSDNTINFLKNLNENNNKTWFEENRGEYEAHLLNPMKELVKDLGPFMLEIDPYFEINPRRCISRIYRDVRFSKDKSPYRPNMWFSFKRNYTDWKIEPTYFFEIFYDYYRYGMGFYNAPKEMMDKLREMIVENNREFAKVNSVYKKQSTFKLEGQCYKRILNNDVSEELRDWYQRKEIFMVCNRNIDGILFSRELTTELLKGFKELMPVYQFFSKLRDRG